ncbi:hypothetical protein GOP47_0027698 [Adiantum capillus-veneris]|nr:hypothetical protein GOP47_0027698 [Adiantum capillus-veneris]
MRFQVFNIMYMSACRSNDYDFRASIMRILEISTTPPRFQTQRGWSQAWWSRRSTFTITAGSLGNLNNDLRHIKWCEKLRLVHYYTFWPTNVKAMAADGSVNLNRWVHDKVITVIPKDRVIVIGRTSHFLGKGWTIGLPQLPATYRLLAPIENPPRIFLKSAQEYHNFKYTPED